MCPFVFSQDLIRSGGELTWLDLDRNRYLNEKDNQYVDGSLRVRCFYTPCSIPPEGLGYKAKQIVMSEPAQSLTAAFAKAVGIVEKPQEMSLKVRKVEIGLLNIAEMVEGLLLPVGKFAPYLQVIMDAMTPISSL